MLIEKLRCESICLPSSHYAALSVNITPEENFHWEFLELSFFLLLSFSLCSDDDDTVLWREDKSRPCSCVLQRAYGDDVTTPYSHSLVVLFLTDTAGSLSLAGVNDMVTQVQQVTWLIWLLWKCGLFQMSCAASRLPRSHSGWHSTPLELSLMQSEVTAWDQVQVQITLCLSDSFLTPFAALTAHSIIYSCKQVLMHIHPCFSSQLQAFHVYVLADEPVSLLIHLNFHLK